MEHTPAALCTAAVHRERGVAQLVQERNLAADRWQVYCARNFIIAAAPQQEGSLKGLTAEVRWLKLEVAASTTVAVKVHQ
jgi:hypothetical protein